MPGTSGRGRGGRGLRTALVRCAVSALLVVAYRLLFPYSYALIGSPAFLLGLIPCVVAAALLGLRGAVAAVVVVALIDRQFALASVGPDTGVAAGLIALLVKLLLAGGLGLVVDARRSIASLNARLRHEMDVRQQREESLRQSEELHRALVESLGEGVGLFDREDRVVFANQALATTLQRPHDELIGKRFCELLREESSEAGDEEGEKARGGRTYEVVLESRPSTPLLVTETRLDASGERGPLTLRVVRDLTDRILSERRQRALERELQRSQALQSLAVMAGGVAHDFNNLLCGVVGNAEVARRKLPRAAPSVVKQCLAEIITFAGEAAQLSKQMLAYAGQRSLAIEALEVNSELSAALRLLHATIESKAQLALDLPEGLPEVAADRFQLRQVVTNLVINALEAMEGKRGTLLLRTCSVRLQADSAQRYQVRAGDYVRLSVEDTGCGIAAEVKDRLFDPFFSTKAPGRGMGLAAAAGIVRAHNGWIGVEETSARGTTFGVLWPVARETTRRASPASTFVAPRSVARTILLIDDEPAVRVVTGRLLRELGHQVIEAESGRRGLELFRSRASAIDLVVLDLTMPEQSGEQILEQLTRVRREVRVAITSGFQATDASKLLAVPNVVGFLAKPHTLTNLEMILASLDAGAGRAEARASESSPSAGAA